MPPIEVIELGTDGTYTTMPDPGDATTSPPVAPQEGMDATAETATPRTGGAQGESAPPHDAPPPDDASLAASPSEGEDADVPDDAATVPFVNRRIKQLNAKRRETEKLLAEERSQNALRQAQLEARLDTLTKVLSGAAPAMPEAPAPPTGPPQSEQYSSWEEFDRASARYEAEQVVARERQQAGQLRFQQDLMSREEQFKQAHPDFDTVVSRGLAGLGGTFLQYALMHLPDGPAMAYALATQPEMVQRLHQMPPPMVLVELGRLSGGEASKGVRNEGGAGGAPNVPPFLPPASLPSSPLPEPMAPVGGGGSMVQPTYSEGMSQAEYEKYRARTSQIPYVRRS